jgi:hypothetical protein
MTDTAGDKRKQEIIAKQNAEVERIMKSDARTHKAWGALYAGPALGRMGFAAAAEVGLLIPVAVAYLLRHSLNPMILIGYAVFAVILALLCYHTLKRTPDPNGVVAGGFVILLVSGFCLWFDLGGILAAIIGGVVAAAAAYLAMSYNHWI